MDDVMSTTIRHYEEAQKKGHVDVEKMVAEYPGPWIVNDIVLGQWTSLCFVLNFFE